MQKGVQSAVYIADGLGHALGSTVGFDYFLLLYSFEYLQFVIDCCLQTMEAILILWLKNDLLVLLYN